MATSKDVNTFVGDVLPSNIGLTSSVLPEAKVPILGNSSDTGVSTRSVDTSNIRNKAICHWYALRTTYGREKKAYDYIVKHGGCAFLPTIISEKVIEGKRKLIEVSRFPNLFFAYGTEDAIKEFVYDNINLQYLRFYYKHIHLNGRIEKEPMIVPDYQMRSLQIICGNKNDADTIILNEEIKKFQKGEKVRVKEGDFEGVVGIVSRFRGQQRVGLVIDGLLTAVTAYIPSAFLEKVDI